MTTAMTSWNTHPPDLLDHLETDYSTGRLKLYYSFKHTAVFHHILFKIQIPNYLLLLSFRSHPTRHHRIPGTYLK